MWVFFTLQSSLASPSEAGLLSRLLAWAQVTGEIRSLLFRKGRNLALSLPIGLLVVDAQLGGSDLPTWLHKGCLKSTGRNKADNSP